MYTEHQRRPTDVARCLTYRFTKAVAGQDLSLIPTQAKYLNIHISLKVIPRGFSKRKSYFHIKYLLFFFTQNTHNCGSVIDIHRFQNIFE